MSGSPLPTDLESRKVRASAWFTELRDQIVAALEKVEENLPKGAMNANLPPGRFEKTPWKRTDHTGAPGGGGVMAMMRGRVFEKVGVHVSAVHGEFSPEFRSQMSGAEDDPRFWAAEIGRASGR